jgi:hypothetical protein
MTKKAGEIGDLVRLFRQSEGELIRGAFIRVTARKVAQWLAENRLQLIRSDGELVGAAVMVKVTARQQVSDFTGTVRTQLGVGDVFAKRLACRPGFERVVTTALREASSRKARLWLRIWQEQGSNRKIVEELGGTWICTKVLAGSELVGIWCVGSPAVVSNMPVSDGWTLRRLSMSPLSVGRAQKALFKKCSNFTNHYSSKYYISSSWSAFSLRSYGGRSDFMMKPAEMSKKWKKQNPEKLLWKLENTDARKALPEFEPLIRAVPGLIHRIRLMRLSAGGLIKRHSDVVDRETGTAEGKILRIHIPITTNPQVQFTSWDLLGRPETVHMKEGEAWYVDTRKPHQVENAGSTERVHLVIDVLSCSNLLASIGHSKKALVEE